MTAHDGPAAGAALTAHDGPAAGEALTAHDGPAVGEAVTAHDGPASGEALTRMTGQLHARPHVTSWATALITKQGETEIGYNPTSG